MNEHTRAAIEKAKQKAIASGLPEAEADRMIGEAIDLVEHFKDRHAEEIAKEISLLIVRSTLTPQKRLHLSRFALLLDAAYRSDITRAAKTETAFYVIQAAYRLGLEEAQSKGEHDA